MASSVVSLLVIIILILAYNSAVTAGPKFATNGQPSDVTVLEGETAEFHCLFSGFESNVVHMYTVHWEIVYPNETTNFLTKGKGEAKVEEKYDVLTTSTVENSTLTVKNVTISDQEGYRCLLYETNSLELISRPGLLTLLGKPEFRQKPSHKTVDEGDTVTLRCRLQNVGQLHFQVRWFGNGLLISRNYDILQTDASRFSGKLMVQGKKRSGIYDLVVTGIKRISDFYCDVYLIDTKRVVLKSDIARVVVRDSPAVTGTAIHTTSKLSDIQPPKNTDKFLQNMIIVSVIVSVVTVVTSIAICVGCKLIRYRKGRKLEGAANQSANFEESPRNTNANSWEGNIVEYQEMQDVENMKYEEIKSKSVTTAVTKESENYQPYEDVA